MAPGTIFYIQLNLVHSSFAKDVWQKIYDWLQHRKHSCKHPLPKGLGIYYTAQGLCAKGQGRGTTFSHIFSQTVHLTESTGIHRNTHCTYCSWLWKKGQLRYLFLQAYMHMYTHIPRKYIMWADWKKNKRMINSYISMNKENPITTVKRVYCFPKLKYNDIPWSTVKNDWQINCPTKLL